MAITTSQHDAPENHSASTRQRRLYRLLWRWHFYAGVFCLPFVIWLSCTGMIYLFKPQLEPLLERAYAHVTDSRQLLPPSRLVELARRAVPGSVLNAYQLPSDAHAATQVLVGRGKLVWRVYLDPSSGKVLRVIGDDDRFMRVIFYLHGELLLGDRGSMLVELAASWTILLLLTGLYLWWPRGSRFAGVLYPRLSRGGRLMWRDLHAVTGFWVSLLALFLLISGLPWSKSWGGMLADLRQWSSSTPLRQDWSVGSSSEAKRRLAMNSQGGPHAAQEMAGMADMPGMTAAQPDISTAPDYHAVDRLLPTVRYAALAPPVLISPPSRDQAQWTARSDAEDRSQRSSLVLDAARAQIISRTDFSQRPLLDRMIGYGVAIHEGRLFGPLNQALGVFTGLGLLTMSVSATILWWRRRPTGTLGAPAPSSQRVRYPGMMIAALCLLGVVLPLLGASMLMVRAAEWLILRRHSASRRFLGLG